MKVVRAGWTSASFTAYAGAFLILFACFIWFGVISDEHSNGGFAGWTVLFYAVTALLAIGFLRSGRRLVAGLLAFVAVGLFAVMVGAFFSWFGWLSDKNDPFSGFHWGDLGLELLTLLAALTAIRIFRFPLIGFIAAAFGYIFVTDVVSSGGNWSATVTLLVGIALFLKGLGLDGGDSRPYGFWVHVVAGLTIGGALIYFWHESNFDWALIIVTALVFMAVGGGIRRSSYSVLGVIGLIAATAYYTVGEALAPVEAVYGYEPESPTTWALPVGYIGLGAFLILLALLFGGRRAEAEAS